MTTKTAGIEITAKITGERVTVFFGSTEHTIAFWASDYPSEKGFGVRPLWLFNRMQDSKNQAIYAMSENWEIVNWAAHAVDAALVTPVEPSKTVNPEFSTGNIGLRDYFAAKALSTVVAAIMQQEGHRWSPADFAHDAYALADAMLIERAKTEAAK